MLFDIHIFRNLEREWLMKEEELQKEDQMLRQLRYLDDDIKYLIISSIVCLLILAFIIWPPVEREQISIYEYKTIKLAGYKGDTGQDSGKAVNDTSVCLAGNK